MAPTSKCPHCGGVVRSDEKICPHCGAENALFIEDSPRTIQHPKTIEELQEYCAERGMPLLRMRFFIGEDYREPKAFGIYRDGQNVVVYKNKADGSRAIRYAGPDEARGVDELFQKLLSECHSRGIYPDGKPGTRAGGGPQSGSEPNASPDLQLPGEENAPKTIEELRSLCEERKVPLETLGFVIGDTSRLDFFGITRNEGKFAIYRTKKDGSRTYTYRSEDEAAAVSQYYHMILSSLRRKNAAAAGKSGMKKSTIVWLILAFPFMIILGIVPIWIYLIDSLICAIFKKNRPWPRNCRRDLEAEESLWRRLWLSLCYSFRFGPDSGLDGRAKKTYLWVCWIAPLIRSAIAIALAVGLILSIKSLIHRNDGYYMAPDSTVYYQDGGDWYAYDPDDYYDWYEVDDFPEDNYKDYLMEDGWEADWDGVSYSEGSVWSEPSSSDSSDSYSSSDYDSWDSDDTDWDSDW